MEYLWSSDIVRMPQNLKNAVTLGFFFKVLWPPQNCITKYKNTLISYTYLIIKRNLVPFLSNKSKAILRFLFELKVHSFMPEKFMRLKNIFQITILSRKFKLVVSCYGRENSNFLLRIVILNIFWAASNFLTKIYL